MVHQSDIQNYGGTLEDLAEEIGNLKYDALAKFLDLLANKIEKDGKKDDERNRTQLSSSLFHSAHQLMESKKSIEKAWKISAPYMDY